MNESLPESDDQLSLKKRARRRLIGAVVFVSVAAVVLPMVMDEEAPPATPSVEFTIPAQEKGFSAPAAGATKPVVGVAEPTVAAVTPPVPSSAPIVEAAPVAATQLPATVPVVKPAVKPVVKVEPKPVKVDTAKPVTDAKRAQALLEDKVAESPTGADGPHVVLIGAFSNPANVQTLQKKLGELGLRVYTEPLDSPQGKKTRVRAGPFANREAADKAVVRMKAIGVSGVVAPKS